MKPSHQSGIKVYNTFKIQLSLSLVRILPADRVLEQLHEKSMSSSPRTVPTSSKTPSQENNSLGSNCSSSGRWKRSSPDPHKMMMGRSPNVIDNNAKRILATTPSRRASNHVERVGSPSLSGYPVRQSAVNIASRLLMFVVCFRAFVGARWMVARRLSETDSFRMISTTFMNTKRTISTSHIRVLIKTTATTKLPSHRKPKGTHCSAIFRWYTLWTSTMRRALR